MNNFESTKDNNSNLKNNYLENKILKNKQESGINEKDIIVKIIGIGGLGGKIVQEILKKGLKRQIEYIAINTDKNELEDLSLIENRKYLIGENLTDGNGTGGNREFGESAATDSEKELKEKIFELSKNQFVILIAGMGGGTGSGATPIIGKIAKDLDSSLLSIAFIPRSFEGNKIKELVGTSLKDIKKISPTLEYYMDKIINFCDDKKDLLSCLSEISYKLLELIYLILHFIGSPNLDFNKFLNVIENNNCFFDYLEMKNENNIEKIINSLLKSINNLDLKNISSKKVFLEIHHNYLSSKEETLLMETISKNLDNDNNELYWGINKEINNNNNEEKFINLYFLISGEKHKEKDKTEQENNEEKKVAINEATFTL